MPKYKLPPLKENEDEAGDMVKISGESRWERMLGIPISKEILNSLEVGQEVTVTLKGTVNALRMEDSKDRPNRGHLELEIAEVEAYSGNEYEKLDEGMDED